MSPIVESAPGMSVGTSIMSKIFAMYESNPVGAGPVTDPPGSASAQANEDGLTSEAPEHIIQSWR